MTAETVVGPAPVATTSRITATFGHCASEGRAALMPFLTVGYPTLAQTAALLPALVAGGADVIELGVPFSDPLADGVTIQQTSQVALDQGTTLADCLQLVRSARAAGVTTPIILMGYANPFLQYGPERLAADAAAAGVDGFIVADLPVEETDEFLTPLRAHGLDLIFMVAPTSTDQRLAAIAARASGFIYCVSLTGVTGARSSLSAELPAYIERIRAHTDLPLALGFGISRPEHVHDAAQLVDGVIVASALINYLETIPLDRQTVAATEFVRALAAATHHDAPGAA